VHVALTLVACLGLAGVALGSTNVPSWWIDRGETRYRALTLEQPALPPPPDPAIEFFTVELSTSDHNSGLMPPGIEYRVPAWMPPVYADWRVGDAVALWLDRATHANDGIFALDYRATDKAGNPMTASAAVKIDTRPPATDGAAGWINGLEPYTLTAVDQVPGAGVAATVYRVDQSTPWLVNAAAAVSPELLTEVALTPAGGTPVQGSLHTVDFGSVDAALPFEYDPATWLAPSFHWGNVEGTGWVWSGGKDDRRIEVYTGYQTRTVRLDVTAPVVTATAPDPDLWQAFPATVVFSGTDVGSGYAFTEWSTDGVDWTRGETAVVGGDGVITVSYRGVDNVGLVSATQSLAVRVASTPPTVAAADASVKKGRKATFRFNVTAVTPLAQVVIEVRSRSGKTLSTHRYADVPTNADVSRSFRVDLRKGKYAIRIGAVDEAGNVQSRRGAATLTVR
jgi:hypothetical protein